MKTPSLHHHSGLCSVSWSGIGRPPKPWCVRFYSKVQFGTPESCWPWKPALIGVAEERDRPHISTNFSINIPGRPRQMNASRWLWIAEIGNIPTGYDIDHKCELFYCMNLSHMQVVPSLVNQGILNVERGVYRRRIRDAYGRYVGGDAA